MDRYGVAKSSQIGGKPLQEKPDRISRGVVSKAGLLSTLDYTFDNVAKCMEGCVRLKGKVLGVFVREQLRFFHS
jgi:hypothetical protein